MILGARAICFLPLRQATSNLRFEIRDGALQSFLERHLRLPFEHTLGKGDVGTSLFRIVGWQSLVNDLRFSTDEPEREFGKLEHGELARIADVQDRKSKRLNSSHR